jgi:hypothetical protein
MAEILVPAHQMVIKLLGVQVEPDYLVAVLVVILLKLVEEQVQAAMGEMQRINQALVVPVDLA